jgi:hypothetical protein
MKRDPREPQREALGATTTRRTGRLVTIALGVASAVLLVAVVLGRGA